MNPKTLMHQAIIDLKLEYLAVQLLRHSIFRYRKYVKGGKDNSELRYYVYCSLLDKKSWYDIGKDVDRSYASLSQMKRKTWSELRRALTPGHEARKRSRHAAKYLIEVLNAAENSEDT